MPDYRDYEEMDFEGEQKYRKRRTEKLGKKKGRKTTLTLNFQFNTEIQKIIHENVPEDKVQAVMKAYDMLTKKGIEPNIDYIIKLASSNLVSSKDFSKIYKENEAISNKYNLDFMTVEEARFYFGSTAKVEEAINSFGVEAILPQWRPYIPRTKKVFAEVFPNGYDKPDIVFDFVRHSGAELVRMYGELISLAYEEAQMITERANLEAKTQFTIGDILQCAGEVGSVEDVSEVLHYVGPNSLTGNSFTHVAEALKQRGEEVTAQEVLENIAKKGGIHTVMQKKAGHQTVSEYLNSAR